MKKILSVFLAALMIALAAVPAFAEGKSVIFNKPGAGLDADAYTFLKVTDGEFDYHIDDLGDTIEYDSVKEGSPLCGVVAPGNNVRASLADVIALCESGNLDKRVYIYAPVESGVANLYKGADKANPTDRYIQTTSGMMAFSNILFDDDRDTVWNAYIDYMFNGGAEEVHFYSPSAYDMGSSIEVEEGELVSFKVLTSKVYDITTVTVYVNGALLEPNSNGEYSFFATGQSVFNVNVKDETLLRNHYTVALTKGDGYNVKTLEGENNHVVYYGDSFKFRVKITKGFTGSGMSVKAIPANSDLSEFIGDEFDSVIALFGTEADGVRTLTSEGLDADGNRIYTLDNITKNYKIVVSGVKEESKSGILNFLKRIIRYILHALGIKIDAIEDLITPYAVNIVNEAPGVTYEIVEGAEKDVHASRVEIMNGDSVGIKVTKKTSEQNVGISYGIFDPYTTPTGIKPYSYSNPEWKASYNRYTGEYTYSAVFYFDSIGKSEDFKFASEQQELFIYIR